MTDLYAVMGHPVSHSKSPNIHSRFAAQTGESLRYEAIHVDPGCFVQAVNDFQAGGGCGLNITLPFKQEAYSLARYRTDRAKRAGAVNTLWFDETVGVCADNTDGVGLVRDLAQSCGLRVGSLTVLLIGAGGAARGAACALLEEGPQALVVANRTHEKALALVSELGCPAGFSAQRFEELVEWRFDLVINATAASLAGDILPIPESAIGSESVCYDMMYGAGETAFTLWGRRASADVVSDGLGMLVEQAAESFFIWRNVRPETRSVLGDLRAELATKKPV